MMQTDTTHETIRAIIQRCADAFGEPVYGYRMIYSANGDEWLFVRDSEVLASGTLDSIVQHIEALFPLLEQRRQSRKRRAHDAG
jgi:hypothetical protein